jgi:hypothetical protein
MKWLMQPVAVALGIIIVIAGLMLFGSVYLKMTQAPLAPAATPQPVTTVLPTQVPTTLPETSEPTPEMTTPVPTPTRDRSFATAAKPSEDADKYYNLPYKSTVYNPKGNLPPTIYHQTYDGKFQKEGVDARVLQAPLIIDFVLTSAQGPTRSRFLLTVRNNETQELLAQEGFYGAYTENSQKRLYFSAPGTYHIDMYGTFVNVDLTVRAPPG